MRTGIVMKLSLPIVVIILSFFSLTGISQSYDRNYIDGQIYLKFKDHVQVNIPVNPDRSVDLENAPFLDDLRQKFDITGLSRPYDLNNDPKLLKTFLINFSQFDRIELIKEELAQNQDIEYVENVPLYAIDYTPNDSLYNRDYGYANWNWHLDVINAEMAWDLNKGSSDIKVAVVDGAVWIDHPDLVNKIVLSEDVTQPGTQNSNPPSSGDPAVWSHGTHCAGLVGAQSDNLIGIASIGYNVSIIGVKASTIPGFVTAGYSGIQWAANNGADVISLSWGGPGYSGTEQNVINAAYALGVVIVAAAGNDNVSTTQYPAGYNHVIAVASTNENDEKTDFSNYGTYVDVSAPGGYGTQGPGGLLSSTWDYTDYGYYDVYAGTSMATPLTAGLCGLILSVNPDLTPDELENILKSTTENIDAVPGNEIYAGKLGTGRIDAYAAVSSTPYQPAADFNTPIPYIKPGTSVQFTDMTAGVPDTWSWEFTGGQPHFSGQQNPSVTYLTEGVFSVILEVTNDFGQDTETKTGYITVTNTPVPWILFSASENMACNMDTIVFTDESLYVPTVWNWEILPATITFVDGTTANSQNPHVRFEAPGYYSVTLTASNNNGSNSTTIEDMIFIEGLQLNYSEDFETGSTNDFNLSHNPRARVKVDSRSAAPGSTYGLHFEGSTLTGGWSGGPINTTPEQAWNTNTNFHGFAQNCSIDATGIAGVGLSLDLRQTYSIGNRYSWFRVLVNGVQVSDIDGFENFNPVTNTDPFDTKIFDLSAYGNTMFNLTFQTACYLGDKFYAEGDNVFVDNIMISNTTVVQEGINAAGVLTYPNPVTDVLNYSAHGTGDQITLKVLNMQGQIILQESIKGYDEGDVRQLNTSDLSSGMYLLQISGNEGTTSKKFIIQ
jgi:PKD repeat protein